MKPLIKNPDERACLGRTLHCDSPSFLRSPLFVAIFVGHIIYTPQNQTRNFQIASSQKRSKTLSPFSSRLLPKINIGKKKKKISPHIFATFSASYISREETFSSNSRALNFIAPRVLLWKAPVANSVLMPPNVSLINEKSAEHRWKVLAIVRESIRLSLRSEIRGD